MRISPEHSLNDAVLSPEAFPVVQWGDSRVTFHAAAVPHVGIPTPASVVFARHEECWVIADIPGRGWCTPSGRLEPGETPTQAAIRETYEEIGGDLMDPIEIGYYELIDSGGAITFFPAFAGRVAEFGNIPDGSESLGVRCVTLAELPGCYWRWDPLLEAMFKYAATFFEASE